MILARSVVVATAIAVTSNFLSVGVVEGAAVACQGVCEIPLPTGCEAMLDLYAFGGDCCSLVQDATGNCTLLTSSECYLQVEGETGCEPQPDGTVGCVVPGTYYYSNSTEACPASEYEVVLRDAEELYGEDVEETDVDTKEPASAPNAAPSSAESVGSRLLVILSSMMVLSGGAIFFV